MRATMRCSLEGEFCVLSPVCHCQINKLVNKKLELSVLDTTETTAIPGNELADVIAKTASSLPEEHCYQPVSYGSSCVQIRMCTKDPEIVHRRTREVYGLLSMDQESQTKSRADKKSLLAKLRTSQWSFHWIAGL